MSKPLVLRTDADAHPNLCRIDGCTKAIVSRGLCQPHYDVARNAKKIDDIGLPKRVGGRPKRLVMDTSHPQIQANITNAQLRELEQLRASDAKLRDALAASADKLQVLVAHLNLDPADDLARQARDIAAWMAVAVEAANAFGVTSPGELKVAIDDAVADTHLDVIPPPAAPGSSRAFRVQQAGRSSLGVLFGHLDATGLFRVTAGPLRGAAYGCLYSAEPVERPELGEPETGATVWVRTVVDEVTPASILTSDGGRFPRAAWGPERFVRRSTRPTTRLASQTTPTVADDDIPF